MLQARSIVQSAFVELALATLCFRTYRSHRTMSRRYDSRTVSSVLQTRCNYARRCTSSRTNADELTRSSLHLFAVLLRYRLSSRPRDVSIRSSMLWSPSVSISRCWKGQNALDGAGEVDGGSVVVRKLLDVDGRARWATSCFCWPDWTSDWQQRLVRRARLLVRVVSVLAMRWSACGSSTTVARACVYLDDLLCSPVCSLSPQSALLDLVLRRTAVRANSVAIH